jgi:NlpC/P60 family protein
MLRLLTHHPTSTNRPGLRRHRLAARRSALLYAAPLPQPPAGVRTPRDRVRLRARTAAPPPGAIDSRALASGRVGECGGIGRSAEAEAAGIEARSPPTARRRARGNADTRVRSIEAEAECSDARQADPRRARGDDGAQGRRRAVPMGRQLPDERVGFDCSGLVYWAYGRLGVELPHSSYALYHQGRRVARSRLKAGEVPSSPGSDTSACTSAAGGC